MGASEIAPTPSRGQGTRCGRFLRLAFREWERHDIPYVVLRNYAGLPEIPGNDVDVLVAGIHAARAERLLLHAAGRAGFRLHNRAEFGPTCLYFSCGRQQVQIDLFTWLSWRGFQIVPEAGVLAARRRRGAFFIPALADEAALSLLTGLLYRGEVKPKYRALIRLAFESDSAALSRVSDALGRAEGRAIAALVARADWPAIERRAGRVRASLIMRRAMRRPFATAGRILHDVRRLVGRYRSPPGLAVVLVGPDGCGKSTVAAALTRELAGTFPEEKVRYVHWKPEVFPVRRTSAGGPVREPHARPARSRVVSLAYFAFHVLEFAIGTLVRIRPVLFRNGLVVIDRFYYDFYVDPARYRLSIPRAVVRWANGFVPRPGPVFYLDASSSTLRRRKAELSIEETSRQREAFRSLVGALEGGEVVDATATPELVTGEVVDRILGWLAERTRLRRIAA